MNLNLTLFGEIITFAILVWVTMKYVWPPIIRAVEERNKTIADGLAAAERGKQELSEAKTRREELMHDARARASEAMRDGERRRSEIVDAARTEAESEKERILRQGREQVEHERAAMSREMQGKLSSLVVAGAEKILRREVDEKTHTDILAEMRKGL